MHAQTHTHTRTVRIDKLIKLYLSWKEENKQASVNEQVQCDTHTEATQACTRHKIGLMFTCMNGRRQACMHAETQPRLAHIHDNSKAHLTTRITV